MIYNYIMKFKTSFDKLFYGSGVNMSILIVLYKYICKGLMKIRVIGQKVLLLMPMELAKY